MDPSPASGSVSLELELLLPELGWLSPAACAEAGPAVAAPLVLSGLGGGGLTPGGFLLCSGGVFCLSFPPPFRLPHRLWGSRPVAKETRTGEARGFGLCGCPLCGNPLVSLFQLFVFAQGPTGGGTALGPRAAVSGATSWLGLALGRVGGTWTGVGGPSFSGPVRLE